MITKEKIFEINPGETELEGLLRSTKIMTRLLDLNTPRKTQSYETSCMVYSLVRYYIGMYDAVPKNQMMLFLLKYPEVADLYNRVKEISERPHYKMCLSIFDAVSVT